MAGRLTSIYGFTMHTLPITPDMRRKLEAALAGAHAEGRKQELSRAADRIVKRRMRLQGEKA